MFVNSKVALAGHGFRQRLLSSIDGDDEDVDQPVKQRHPYNAPSDSTGSLAMETPSVHPANLRADLSQLRGRGGGQTRHPALIHSLS